MYKNKISEISRSKSNMIKFKIKPIKVKLIQNFVYETIYSVCVCIFNLN